MVKTLWARLWSLFLACMQAVVRAILDRVWEKGDIYKAKYEGGLPSLMLQNTFLHILKPLGMSQLSLCKEPRRP